MGITFGSRVGGETAHNGVGRGHLMGVLRTSFRKFVRRNEIIG